MGDGTIGSTAAELQGRAKEAVGDATDDVDLRAEGAAEENRAESERPVNGDKDPDLDAPTDDVDA